MEDGAYKFRSDLHNTGVYDDGGIRPVNTLRWNFTTGGVVESSPAVVDGVVYIGSSDKKVYAFDAATGAKIWEFTTDGEVRSSPAVSDGVVYVGSEHGTFVEQNFGGNLYALDAETGAKIWNFSTKAAIRSSPAVADDIVYVGCYDDNFYAFDTATGDVIWSTRANFAKSSPAVSDGTVYVGGGDVMVYAFNATDGSERWSSPTGGWIDSSPAIANDMLYIGSWDKNVYALNTTTGDQIWRFATRSLVTSNPAVKDGVVYVGSGDGKVYAIEAAGGRELWNYTIGSYVSSSPAVANGIVYIGGFDKKLYALDAITGAHIWTYTTNGSVYSSPAVADGTVYVGSNDHKVFAIGGNLPPQPPESITNLHNTTFQQNLITWNWTDPTSPTFDHIMVYLDGVFQHNVTRGTRTFTATELNPETAYTIATHTVGTDGLINYTWVNHTGTTASPTVAFTITATAGTGGMISPFGPVSVPQGSDKTFTITPNTGSSIADVKVDNVSQGTVSSFTFTNVQANHTITATFTPLQANFTITATAGTGGMISPFGPVSVPQGSDKTFTITPDTGFSVADVKVDNVSQGAVRGYTFADVQANHTISAAFSSEGKRGTLYVASYPSNAAIFIDGVVSGQTDQFVYGVTPGIRNLTLAKGGYLTKTVIIDMPANLKVLPPITLQRDGGPEGSGTLYIASSPSGATIFIDEMNYGQTNKFVYGVPSGICNLTLVKDGYQPKTLIIEVPAGDLKVLAPISMDRV